MHLAGALVVAGSGLAQAQPSSELDVVNVTAPRRVQGLEMRRQSSAGKLIFDREELDQLDAGNVGELLRKLPGAGVFADPDSRSGRGKKRDRYMPTILVDGQPLPGGDRSSSTAFRLPVELIERVEIIRAATPEFAYAGPGGTINLILRETPALATRSARMTAGVMDDEPVWRVEGQYGNRQDDLSYSLGMSLQQQPQMTQHERDIWRWSVGTLSSRQREQVHESGNDTNLAMTPRLQWQGDQGQQFVVSSFINLNQKSRDGIVHRMQWLDPQDEASMATEGQDDESETSHNDSARLMAQWRQRQAGQGEWSVRLSLQGEAESKNKGLVRHDAAGAVSEIQRTEENRLERETSLQLRHKRNVAEAHLLSGAIEWRIKHSEDKRQRTINGAPQSGLADAHVWLNDRRLLGWMQDEWQWADDHLLTPGVRWQMVSSSVRDAQVSAVSRRDNGWEPSVHYLWQIDAAWNLRASVAASRKSPGLRDIDPTVREASGTNSATNADKVGNPTLQSERTRSLDLGVEHFLPEQAGMIGASFFQRWVDRKIERLLRQEGSRWVERPYNVGNALERGVLIDAKWRLDALGDPALTLRASTSYTHVHSRKTEAGQTLAEGPRRSINLGVERVFESIKTELGGSLNYIAALDRERTAQVVQRQGARRQIDLYALWRVDRQSRLRLSLNNVSQEMRRDSAQEYDALQQLVRSEQSRDQSVLSVLLSFEHKW